MERPGESGREGRGAAVHGLTTGPKKPCDTLGTGPPDPPHTSPVPVTVLSKDPSPLTVTVLPKVPCRTLHTLDPAMPGLTWPPLLTPPRPHPEDRRLSSDLWGRPCPTSVTR